MTDIITRRPPPAVIVRNWRPIDKGSLRGSCDIETPSGLIICNVLLHQSHGRRWAAPSGFPMLDRDHRHLPDPQRPGKFSYTPAIRFRSSEVRERFEEAVLGALEEAGIAPWIEEAGP